MLDHNIKQSPLRGMVGMGGGIGLLGAGAAGGPQAFVRASTWQGQYYDNDLVGVSDSSGNVYFAYSVRQTYNGNNGYSQGQGFIEKIDSFGNIVWSKKYWGNGSQTSTFERASFRSIAINSDESNIALNSHWYDSNNSAERNVIIVLDTATGNMVNSDVEYFTWSYIDTRNARLRYDYTNKDRLHVSFYGVWDNYQYWITGPNKTSTSIVSSTRSDQYANQQPIITDMYNKADTGSSSTNDYEIFARIQQSSTSGRFVSAYYSFTNNGTSPQSAYTYQDYWYTSHGGMISGKRSAYEYIVYAEYVNNSQDSRITLTSPYSHTWTRRSAGSSGNDYWASSIRVAYDHVNDKIYAAFYISGGLYRRFMVAELSNSDGSIVQSKVFYVKVLGGTQSNPSALSLPTGLQNRNNFWCDGEFLYLTAYANGYGANSHILMKFPTDFSLLSDGEVVVSSKFSIVFETPSTGSFRWEAWTGAALSINLQYTYSSPSTNNLSNWAGATIDNGQDIGSNHVLGIANL